MALLALASIELSEKSDISQAHFYILTARFLCALLLHVTVEPEVNQGIQMYRYFVNHSIQWNEEQKLRNKTADENDEDKDKASEEDESKQEQEDDKDKEKPEDEKKKLEDVDDIKKLVV
eukprot:CAMPEP_0116876690 /NCGR_PEP_ID=MMETSP0463-20121206/8580_1 /TAXON_ID=181622 /ORGANISM="Strombidinopsis sp, Strain SopsisLIS2011" /LENGTH=118 /DNA_ID=CAMNT_0004523443 /DNA_START=1196 /DNA_END=1552 /DNA_ORIENTATION=+